ncbi:hypothetical protein [Mesorhizobium sp. WSM2239]|uniref:Uncharacterized protein n=2 Tax=unclassified Mesorhizobium TaxID=325217 RepID=A0AAU8DGE4_9HYPH
MNANVSTFTIAAGRDMAGGDYLRLRNSNFVGCYVACEQPMSSVRLRAQAEDLLAQEFRWTAVSQGRR